MIHKILIIAVIFISCKSARDFGATSYNKNDIVYYLPYKVDSTLNQIVKQQKQLYFCLYNNSDSFTLYASTFDKKRVHPFVLKTNRQIFIAGKFFPIILDVDMMFGTTSTPKEILSEFNSRKEVTIERYYTIHEGFYIKFKRNGDIISSGFAFENKGREKD